MRLFSQECCWGCRLSYYTGLHPHTSVLGAVFFWGTSLFFYFYLVNAECRVTWIFTLQVYSWNNKSQFYSLSLVNVLKLKRVCILTYPWIHVIFSIFFKLSPLLLTYFLILICNMFFVCCKFFFRMKKHKNKGVEENRNGGCSLLGRISKWTMLGFSVRHIWV